jgi:hypothetical protein
MWEVPPFTKYAHTHTKAVTFSLTAKSVSAPEKKMWGKTIPSTCNSPYHTRNMITKIATATTSFCPSSKIAIGQIIQL